MPDNYGYIFKMNVACVFMSVNFTFYTKSFWFDISIID